MKILNMSYEEREEIEEALRKIVEIIQRENQDTGFDYIDVCSTVADLCHADSLEVEHIYDDLYVNNHQEWDCIDQYDEDELDWDEENDCYKVKEDKEY